MTAALHALAAADSKPAGGAELTEVIAATGGAMLATAALLTLATLHRSGRTQLLRNAAEWASRHSGLPTWSALPSLLAAASLVCALFGMYWDISLHIDDGRDAGPLANPAHYFILIGLFGVFAAGVLASALPDEKPSRTALKIAPGWYAPLGGVVLLAAASFALAGFPLDDLWHRLFGQDVTLWGPTHLMLIGGAGLTLIGHAILLVEGGTVRSVTPSRDVVGRALGFVSRTRLAGVCGGLLIGLSTFQGEFDFGVPQFRLVFQPVLIALAAGIALVAARIYAGRGGALAAVGYFLVIRGLVTLLVGPVLGETTPHFPIWIAEALVVELVALRVSTQRPYRLGALAGLGIGTVGLAAEWGWSHVWMPMPWPSGLLGEALLLVPPVAVAAGMVGGFVGTALRSPLRSTGFTVPRPAVAGLALVVIAAVVGYGLQVSPERGVRAELTTSAPRGPDRAVDLTARITPAEATSEANWIVAIGWQGKTKMFLDQLERIGPGLYRSTEPVPAGGSWKTMVRLHRDDSLLLAPVYLPEDRAIPAKGIPLERNVTRDFVYDHELLQRERKDDVPGWLPAIAYTIVGLIALAFVGVLGWSLSRLARSFAPETARR
jgi:hypothetical protein